MPIRLASHLATLIVMSALGGCTSWRAQRPEVILTDLEPLESTVFEQRLRAHLRVINPNDFDLEIRGMDMTLDVNGARLARGVSPLEVSIPRLSDATTTMDVSTTVFDLLRQAVGLSDRSAIDYRLRGNVHLEGFWGGAIGFDNEGTLGSWTLPGAPDLIPPSSLP